MIAYPILLLASLSAQPPADGSEVIGYQSAGRLYEKCASRTAHGQEYCYAYIAAVSDAARAYQAWLNLRDLCVPAATSQGALRDLYVDYVQQNPASSADQAASIVVLALQERYPCAPLATEASAPEERAGETQSQAPALEPS